ncbi:type III-B CRISPR module RAMP protein Cmr1 [Actinocorallia sp. API 0066]|uniref:type III-B CRISPR module RAMP protein Cmr1 n=1 Tax=Actinocorallia sp. API 0066 TaxID=2896846 RepID=UPI001E418E86|nr:type III-B CRISPR module RAMP protein Cmr1 [Actinocorallia sp. API 0066]MCD0448608.1 type III-B CRISPR module RAMP protein Cmr1 [Actinocorallia sp. API 0066]
MTWTTLTLTVTTPLFNAGAVNGREPDSDKTGIRVPSLRGALRFWFRALAGVITGPDLALLSELEGRALGHTGNASPVRFRVSRQPPLTLPSGRHTFTPPPGLVLEKRVKEPGYWIHYLLGQGLADLGNLRVNRPYVAPGQPWELKIAFGPDDRLNSPVLAALWLLCAYGGLGARTRRGFGGVRITRVDGPLPEPWTARDLLAPPAMAHGEITGLRLPVHILKAAGLLTAYIREELGRPGFSIADWQEPPSFPVLSRQHTLAVLSTRAFPSWEKTLGHAGEQFRRFRASRDYPGARYRPDIKTPEWEDVVHGADDHFTLGALGLPVVYKDGISVGVEVDGKPSRRASPLWIRAVGHGTDWRILSFAFTGSFLPSGQDAPEVVLRGKGPRRTLNVADEDVAELARAWMRRLRPAP